MYLRHFLTIVTLLLLSLAIHQCQGDEGTPLIVEDEIVEVVVEEVEVGNQEVPQSDGLASLAV